jgi:DNA-binding transcriptional regulator YhcF (GntR family)
MNITPRLLRTREVAEILGVHPETVRRRADELGGIHINSRVLRFNADNVTAFIEKAGKPGTVAS